MMILACIQYLYPQVVYEGNMICRSIWEYYESGERMYSELYTADSWWEVHVSQDILQSLKLQPW